jgi:hypothetical protein
VKPAGAVRTIKYIPGPRGLRAVLPQPPRAAQSKTKTLTTPIETLPQDAETKADELTQDQLETTTGGAGSSHGTGAGGGKVSMND